MAYTELHYAQELTKDDPKYPKLFYWEENRPVVKIPQIEASYGIVRKMQQFSRESGISTDRLLALTSLLLEYIPYSANASVSCSWEQDFEGVWDFEFILTDVVKILNKKPVSTPKNDPKARKWYPEFVPTKTQYLFGINYDPESKLYRLRYKLYPSKSWWGFRYIEKLRPFDSLIEYIYNSLHPYIIEATTEMPEAKEEAEEEEFEPID